MALQKRVDLILGARDRSEAAMRGYEARLQRVKRVAVGVAATVGAAFGLAAVTATARGAVDAYGQQELAVRNLATALELAGDRSASTLKDVKDFASGLQAVTTQGDEATLKLSAYLSGLGELSGGALIDATRGTLGLARATGQGSEMMGRAYLVAMQGNFTMLQRYVPELRTLTSEEDKLAAVQKLVSRGLKLMESDAQSATGQVQQAKNAMGDLAEVVGGLMAPAVRAGAESLKLKAEALQGDVSAAGAWIAQHQAMIGTSARVAAAVGGVTAGVWALVVARRALMATEAGRGFALLFDALPGGRLALARVTAATYAQVTAQAALRVSAVALRGALVGGLVVGLGLVVEGFRRARKEGTTFGEAMHNILQDVGLMDDLNRRIEQAGEALHEASRRAGELREEVAGATTPQKRFTAQSELVAAVEAEIDAQERLAAVQKESARREAKEAQAALAMLEKRKRGAEAAAAVGGPAVGATPAAPSEAKLEAARRRAEAAQSRFEQESSVGQNAALSKLREELAALESAMDAFADPAAGRRRGDSVFGSMIGQARELHAEVMKIARDQRTLSADVFAFSASEYEQRMGAIEGRAEALSRRVREGLGAGLISAEDASAQLRTIEGAMKAQKAAIVRESREALEAALSASGGGGGGQPAGAGALEITSRFTGLAARFGQEDRAQDQRRRQTAAMEKVREQGERVLALLEKYVPGMAGKPSGIQRSLR